MFCNKQFLGAGMTLEILRQDAAVYISEYSNKAKEISSVSSPRKGCHLEHEFYSAIYESI